MRKRKKLYVFIWATGNRQVNNFIVNQVMNACENKFLLFIKIRSITIRKLQLNYSPITIRSTLNLYEQFYESFYETFR